MYNNNSMNNYNNKVVVLRSQKESLSNSLVVCYNSPLLFVAVKQSFTQGLLPPWLVFQHGFTTYQFYHVIMQAHWHIFVCLGRPMCFVTRCVCYGMQANLNMPIYLVLEHQKECLFNLLIESILFKLHILYSRLYCTIIVCPISCLHIRHSPNPQCVTTEIGVFHWCHSLSKSYFLSLTPSVTSTGLIGELTKA